MVKVCGVRREEAYMRCNPADTYTKMILSIPLVRLMSNL